MKNLLGVLILCAFAELVFPQNSADVPSYFYKRLEGKIGDSTDIQMNLTRMDSVLDGNYFYEDLGEPIYFQYYSYIRNNGSIHIEEEEGYDDNYNTIITGFFDGNFTSPNEITGKWMGQDSDDQYDFYLKEVYPPGSAKFDIRHLSKNYGESDYTDYAVSIELNYPVMVDYPDQTVEQKVNSYIMNSYLNAFMNGEEGYADLDERMDAFIDSYRTEIEADSDIFKDYKPIYENNEFTSIAFNSDNIISLETVEYLFTGGAHGNSSFTLASFNLKTGEQVKLDDIFYGDYKRELNEVGEAIFRKQFQTDPSQSLYDQGFFGFENGFALNDNFDIYKGGIKFQFNPYEAGAHAIGAPEVFIPWLEIRDIIRDDSPLSKMLNDTQSR